MAPRKQGDFTGRVISAYALAFGLVLWFIICLLIALYGSGA